MTIHFLYSRSGVASWKLISGSAQLVPEQSRPHPATNFQGRTSSAQSWQMKAGSCVWRMAYGLTSQPHGYDHSQDSQSGHAEHTQPASVSHQGHSSSHCYSVTKASGSFSNSQQGQGPVGGVISSLPPMSGERQSIEWRKIDRLPDYEISEYGDVRRLRDSYAYKAGSLLQGTACSRGGYLIYNLNAVGAPRTRHWAHRLVCEAWHGPRPSSRHMVAHSDGDRRNNHFTNLRWATAQENADDRVRHGRHSPGEKNHNAKLGPDQVLEIRRRFKGDRTQFPALAREYDVAIKTIYDVCLERSWRHLLPCIPNNFGEGEV